MAITSLISQSWPSIFTFQLKLHIIPQNLLSVNRPKKSYYKNGEPLLCNMLPLDKKSEKVVHRTTLAMIHFTKKYFKMKV